MKVIVAMIRPERLDAIQGALQKFHPTFLTVSEVLDGQERGRSVSYRGREVYPMARKLRVEVAVESADLNQVVAAIRAAARMGESPGTTGEKLFILQLQECAMTAAPFFKGYTE